MLQITKLCDNKYNYWLNYYLQVEIIKDKWIKL